MWRYAHTCEETWRLEGNIRAKSSSFMVSLNLKYTNLARMAGQQVPGIFLYALGQQEDYSHLTAFTLGAGDPNSGPQIHSAST